MPDLVIAEEDGWFEVSDLVQQIPVDAQRELWGHVGQGRMEDAADLLDMEAGEPLEDRFGTKSIVGVKAVSVPDDVLGERLRVWIQTDGPEPRSPE